jgi:homocitrate synthase NifV
LGIGERAGLASLERVLAFLDGKNGKEDKIAHLREAAELVRSCINQEHYQNRRFAHKSGIHINGTIKDPANYEPMEPERAGSKRILVLSKLIGRSGLAMLLTRHGFRHVEQDLASLLEDIKSEDMLELAGPEEICGYFMERGLERQVV